MSGARHQLVRGKDARPPKGAKPRPAIRRGDKALIDNVGSLSAGKGGAGLLLGSNGPLIGALPDQGLAREEALATTVLGRG